MCSLSPGVTKHTPFFANLRTHSHRPQIQELIATGSLVKRGGDEGSSTGGGAGGWPLGSSRPSSNMSRHDSEDVLGSLLAEGMPDRAAAANLENVPEGEVG